MIKLLYPTWQIKDCGQYISVYLHYVYISFNVRYFNYKWNLWLQWFFCTLLKGSRRKERRFGVKAETVLLEEFSAFLVAYVKFLKSSRKYLGFLVLFLFFDLDNRKKRCAMVRGLELRSDTKLCPCYCSSDLSDSEILIAGKRKVSSRQEKDLNFERWTNEQRGYYLFL